MIKYTYDATGNRIGKWVQVGAGTPRQTAYVRDASGNVMAIYEKGNSEVNGGLLSQIEVPLYGSSRLGVWRPDREVETTGWELFDTDPMTGTGGGIAGGWERGRVQFELSNHLGNVMVTISDARTAVDDGTYQVLTACPTCLPGFPCLPCYDVYVKQNSTPDGVVDYYLPQVLTANDYYPFGMIMPGRKYSEGNYRYGFNGKENDNDVKGEGNQQDYGMRIYDPRLGKFLSVDPLTKSYPMLTPYQFASNRVVDGIDLDGLEYFSSSKYMKSLYAVDQFRMTEKYISANLIVNDIKIHNIIINHPKNDVSEGNPDPEEPEIVSVKKRASSNRAQAREKRETRIAAYKMSGDIISGIINAIQFTKEFFYESKHKEAIEYGWSSIHALNNADILLRSSYNNKTFPKYFNDNFKIVSLDLLNYLTDGSEPTGTINYKALIRTWGKLIFDNRKEILAGNFDFSPEVIRYLVSTTTTNGGEVTYKTLYQEKTGNPNPAVKAANKLLENPPTPPSTAVSSGN